jgi:hypothetical protein
VANLKFSLIISENRISLLNKLNKIHKKILILVQRTIYILTGKSSSDFQLNLCWETQEICELHGENPLASSSWEQSVCSQPPWEKYPSSAFSWCLPSFWRTGLP